MANRSSGSGDPIAIAAIAAPTALSRIGVRRRTACDEHEPQHREPGDELEISDHAAALLAHRELLETVLQALEEALEVPDQAFEHAGRSAYLETVDQPEDLSAEATAARLIDAIQGYLRRAYRSTRGAAAMEFRERILRGAERGFQLAEQPSFDLHLQCALHRLFGT